MGMHRLLLAAGLALTVAGCAEPPTVERVLPLSPNQQMRLAYRFEMHMAGTGAMEERALTFDKAGIKRAVTVTERKETPYTSVEWADAELAVKVEAIPASDCLLATMAVQRLRTGNTYSPKGREKHEESHGFDAAAPITAGDARMTRTVWARPLLPAMMNADERGCDEERCEWPRVLRGCMGARPVEIMRTLEVARTSAFIRVHLRPILIAAAPSSEAR